MSPTDEEIAGLLARLNHPIKYLGFGANRAAQYSPLQREAADALASLQSDLSTAREEIAELDRLVFRLELGGEPWDSELMTIRDGAISRHREALRSGRTKGETL